MSNVINCADRFLGVKLRIYESGRAKKQREEKRFEEARNLVYLCENCDAQQFALGCNGEVQCTECGRYQIGLYCWEPDDGRR